MLTYTSHRPALDGCNSPPATVAYQLFTSSASWSRQTNGIPTAYTKTTSSSSTATELRSRSAEAMAASNCARASSRIRPLSTNCRTIGSRLRCTTTSARISRGAAISRRRCVSMSCRNGNSTPLPQARPSIIDSTSSGTQISTTNASTRRCGSSRASPDSRVRRQSRYSGPPATSEKSLNCCRGVWSLAPVADCGRVSVILNLRLPSSQPANAGSSSRSPVSSYVHGQPAFFQPFFSRRPLKRLSGSFTASPSMPSTML